MNIMYKQKKQVKYYIISNNNKRIILVAIGILIALQVNNWNIDKIEQAKIKDYARLLISDLEETI